MQNLMHKCAKCGKDTEIQFGPNSMTEFAKYEGDYICVDCLLAKLRTGLFHDDTDNWEDIKNRSILSILPSICAFLDIPLRFLEISISCWDPLKLDDATVSILCTVNRTRKTDKEPEGILLITERLSFSGKNELTIGNVWEKFEKCIRDIFKDNRYPDSPYYTMEKLRAKPFINRHCTGCGGRLKKNYRTAPMTKLHTKDGSAWRSPGARISHLCNKCVANWVTWRSKSFKIEDAFDHSIFDYYGGYTESWNSVELNFLIFGLVCDRHNKSVKLYVKTTEKLCGNKHILDEIILTGTDITVKDVYDKLLELSNKWCPNNNYSKEVYDIHEQYIFDKANGTI